MTNTTTQSTTIWSEIDYQTDAGLGAIAQIGMIVLDNDQTLSHEARQMLTIPGIALYESRLSTARQDAPISAGLLHDTFNGLEGALVQVNARFPSKVIALGCTSAAMTIGAEELERRVHKASPSAQVTDPFTGILAALRTLGARRIGYVSPYPRDVAEDMVRKIEKEGFVVPVAKGFHHEGSFIRHDAPFISPESTANAVRAVVNEGDVDAVVVSCTQMRAAVAIDKLEQEIGKPVITSNQALCWHALRLAGYKQPVVGWGKLFERDI
ncbi:maleate cis-trans isomerase family protein [Rhizobium miluonense]|uniref:Maleate isomerase n=1 Tax=Rhizobium miluonense TaxID=411945 RepID=A0A1C3X064_9HYPH|nr:aspartate/glutamate racemase family protein [Rhizobium miluonense]SCB45516.1 maleate isomerase [Rhizobium miluonense]